MEFEFDKEMDFLLRQTAQSEAAFAKANPQSFHVDADELAAFAENALPEKARQRTMLHLADCDRCRTNLAALIELNAGDLSETVHVAEEKFLTAAAALPWYRKLFAVPNLVYAMGALVLVFSGIVSYTLLQNAGSLQNSEVSQTYDKQPSGKGMSSDGDQELSESFTANTAANSNAAIAAPAAKSAMANSAANAPFSPTSGAPLTAMNSNAAMTAPRDADKDLAIAPNPSSPAKEAMPAIRPADPSAGSVPAPAAAPPTENEYTTDGTTTTQQMQTQLPNVQNQVELMPDSRNARRLQVPAQRPELKKRKDEEDRDDASAEKSKLAATTSVGGKTFRRENNVWYDQTYRGQATTNVTRGTDQYKKLDAGLRGIAENLGGTVVIVWKSRAYRIQ